MTFDLSRAKKRQKEIKYLCVYAMTAVKGTAAVGPSSGSSQPSITTWRCVALAIPHVRCHLGDIREIVNVCCSSSFLFFLFSFSLSINLSLSLCNCRANPPRTSTWAFALVPPFGFMKDASDEFHNTAITIIVTSIVTVTAAIVRLMDKDNVPTRTRA